MPNFDSTVEERVQAFLASVVFNPTYHGFEKHLLSSVKLESIHHTTQEIIFSLTSEDYMCNKDGFLHGGAATTLMDSLSSTVLIFIQNTGFWENFGVTRTMSTVFHKAIPCGVKVFVTCDLLAVGKRMATVKAALLDGDGFRYATGVHDKFAIAVSRL